MIWQYGHIGCIDCKLPDLQRDEIQADARLTGGQAEHRAILRYQCVCRLIVRLEKLWIIILMSIYESLNPVHFFDPHSSEIAIMVMAISKVYILRYNTTTRYQVSKYFLSSSNAYLAVSSKYLLTRSLLRHFARLTGTYLASYITFVFLWVSCWINVC